ncbi:glucose PTS transporter subunit IIA [Enterococcus columbae]
MNISIDEVLKGEFLPLSQLADEVFSSGAMGKGIAVKPTAGVVYAPFDGKVTALLPSKHAIDLTNNQGVGLLIHIGKDTVELNGNHFEAYVSLNQLVKKGDKLLSFDIDQLVSEGYTVTTPIIITNTAEYSAVTFEDGNIKIEV